MFNINLMKITAEQIQSGSTLSEALNLAEALRIFLSEEWIHPFCRPWDGVVPLQGGKEAGFLRLLVLLLA